MKEETFCVRGDLLRWARPIQYYLGHEAILTSKSPLMAYWKEDDRSFFSFAKEKRRQCKHFDPGHFGAFWASCCVFYIGLLCIRIHIPRIRDWADGRARLIRSAASGPGRRAGPGTWGSVWPARKGPSCRMEAYWTANELPSVDSFPCTSL